MLPFAVFEEQYLAQKFCKLSKKLHFDSKSNDNWTFLIF